MKNQNPATSEKYYLVTIQNEMNEDLWCTPAVLLTEREREKVEMILQEAGDTFSFVEVEK